MIPAGNPDEARKQIIHFQDTYASHVAVHMQDAPTLTHGLNDSPIGMLSWILQRWKKWSDQRVPFEESFPKDEILTNATIYWVNQTIGSSIRAYKKANRYPWQPSHNRTPAIEAPAGFTFLTGDAYPPGATVENRVDFALRAVSTSRQESAAAAAKAFNVLAFDNHEDLIAARRRKD